MSAKNTSQPAALCEQLVGYAAANPADVEKIEALMAQFVAAPGSTALDAQAFVAMAQGFVASAYERATTDDSAILLPLHIAAVLIGKAAGALEAETGVPHEAFAGSPEQRLN